MAGAASGLFVGVLVGSSVAALTSQVFLLLMMIGGAVGFYLGIDTPQRLFHSTNGQPSKADEKIDTAEFLSALGTFLAGFSSFAAVGMIVVRHDRHIACTTMIMAGWGVWGGPQH